MAKKKEIEEHIFLENLKIQVKVLQDKIQQERIQLLGLGEIWQKIQDDKEIYNLKFYAKDGNVFYERTGLKKIGF